MKVMRSGFGVAVLSLSAIAAGYFGGRPLLEKVEFARAEADVQNTRQELSTVEDLSTVFRHVGKVVEPSVVEIQVTKTVKQTSARMPNNDQLRKYFQRHFGDIPFNFDNPDNGGNDDQGQVEQGTGSGVIMDVENGYGYILTNNHVAGDATKIVVTLADGRSFSGPNDAKVLGADPKSDLAVVQIKADRLIAAKWGSSDDLEKGDWVMAFGAPFGYVGSMTHGIVSALDRNGITNDRNSYEDFIQVDAPINPGNSGGPLVNIHGEVVGINTAIATVSGGFQGIGFAIPSNQAQHIYTALREHGKVTRGWLGVQIGDVARDADSLATAKYMGYKGTDGVMVEGTIPGSPAIGKLHHGDIITAVNGKSVADMDHLRNLIASYAPNTDVTLHVFHDGAEKDVHITLGDQPADLSTLQGGPDDSNQGGAEQQADSNQIFGMTLKALDADSAQQLGLNDLRSGAVITDVAPNSPAADAHLQPGVVITEVGKTPVHNARETIDALKKIDLSKGGVPLYITTREGSQFVFLKAGESQK